MLLRNRHIELPAREELMGHIIKSLDIYFSSNSKEISRLPIAEVKTLKIDIPLRLVAVELPKWGFDAGVEGKILVPAETLTSENADWKGVDWFLAAFLLLESCHERYWELKKNDIRSYAKQLKNWDKRAWDHAWVNRIGIFLALWNEKDFDLQIVRRHYKLDMTHDVDAISKTFQLRLKQGTFNLFNALRRFDNLKKFRIDLEKNLNFVLKNSNISNISTTLEIENIHALKSLFNLSGKLPFQGPKSWLLDPSYKLSDIKQQGIPQMILENGCRIGLHGSYNSSKNARLFKTEKNLLEEELEIKTNNHRQHWLRLNWARTFQIYETNDIGTDSTVMFNDVSGFRNSACLTWNPWNFEENRQHSFLECPTIVMDSHIYDYAENTENGFKRAVTIMQEVKYLGGQAQILWHPHTLSFDYGWKEGFIFICDMLQNQLSDKQVIFNGSFLQWKAQNECR